MAAATRSAAITQPIATIGSSATNQPATPAPASAISAASAALTPPVPSRIARATTSRFTAICTSESARLQDAPSARWDSHTTTPSTPQMSQVPRCGEVERRRVSRM